MIAFVLRRIPYSLFAALSIRGGGFGLLSTDEPGAAAPRVLGNTVVEELLLWEALSPSLHCLG